MERFKVGPNTPRPEGTRKVGWDGNETLPGYMMNDPEGLACVPFTPTAQFPADGVNGDFYVEAFTDECLRTRWKAARDNPDRALESSGRLLVTVPHEYRETGAVDPFGRVDPHGEVDLTEIRRPAFFARNGYREPIARVEDRTYTIEFEVPREAYEEKHLGLSSSLKLRGWYILGDGVVDGSGAKTRALAVVNSGRSMELTLLSDPADACYTRDPRTGDFVAAKFPTQRSERFGMDNWRNYLLALNEAGFDILAYDKRGHGVSGGYNDSNTLEQARDIYRGLDALETGRGLRALMPDGVLMAGDQSAGMLLGGRKARDIPIVLGGASQGSMIVGWAMHINFVENVFYDRPEVPPGPPLHYNVKGAIALAPFLSGVGYRSEASAIHEGRLRTEDNVVFLPSSEILSNVDRWPGLFIARGLWDFAESLEGSFDIYNRAKGLKEIVVVRGPHGENEWGAENIVHVRRRMLEFAKAAVVGQLSVVKRSCPSDLKALVQSAPATWEESSKYDACAADIQG